MNSARAPPLRDEAEEVENDINRQLDESDYRAEAKEAAKRVAAKPRVVPPPKGSVAAAMVNTGGTVG